MTEGDKSIVSVFGSGDPREGDAEYDLAMAVGGELAALGYVVANGGYGGVMEASARGASEAGGDVVGVTCSIWKSKPNRFVTREVKTSSLAERIATLLDLGACGYVCLPGSTGTLVELASAWEMMFKGLMERRPLVCVGDFWRPLVDMMISARNPSGGFVTVVEGPENLGEYFPPRPESFRIA